MELSKVDDMDMYVIGTDDLYNRMKRICEDCASLSIVAPKKVRSYFRGDTPVHEEFEVLIPSKHWDDGDGDSGVEIKVSDIPENVTIVKFVTSI